MNKLIAVLVSLTMLAGCAVQDVPGQPVGASTTGEAEVTLGQAYTSYVEPLYLAGILDETWETTGLISPYLLQNYYKEKMLYPLYPEGKFTERVEAGKVEELISADFNISEWYMRKSKDYEEARGVYVLLGFRQARRICKLTSVDSSDDRVIFNYELYGMEEGEALYKRGMLKAVVDGDHYRYVSNKIMPGTDEELSIEDKMDILWEQLDTYRLPQRVSERDFRRPYTEDTIYLPTQVSYPNDDTAEMLAHKLRFYSCYQGINHGGISDFDEPLTRVNDSEVLSAMLYWTIPLDLGCSGSGNGYIRLDINNHVVSASLQQYAKDGKMVSDIYDRRDIEDSLQYFFGDQVQVEDMWHHDVSSCYSYLGRGGIYVREGDFGGPVFDYPMLVSYSKTDKGYICDAVIVSAFDRETPTWVYKRDSNGDLEELHITSENFAEVTKGNTLRRYTLEYADDGRLILTALETLRQGKDDN